MLSLQLTGVVLGLLYLFLEYKINPWLWLVGIIMPCVHSVLYYQCGLYADAAINLYYIAAGIYGALYWLYHQNSNTHKPHQPQSIKGKTKLIFCLIGAQLVLHALIYAALVNFTNSTVPFCDSLSTALSIVALWMLSRKYTEQWLIWLLVDAISVGLYCYKGIYLTAGLYALYTALAWVGYQKWKKSK